MASEGATERIQRVELKDENASFMGTLEWAHAVMQGRAQWVRRQNRARNLRLGVKKIIDWPWEDAPNLNIPATQTWIKHLMATYFNVVHDNPVAMMEAENEQTTADDVARYEQFYHYKVADQMQARKPLLRLLDVYHEKGRGIFKIVHEDRWESRTDVLDVFAMPPEIPELVMSGRLDDAHMVEALAEHYDLDLNNPDHIQSAQRAVRDMKHGMTEIQLIRRVQAYSGPRWIPIEPKDLILEVNGSSDIQEHSTVIHRFRQRRWEVKEKVESGRYDKQIREHLDNPVNDQKLYSAAPEDVEDEQRDRDAGVSRAYGRNNDPDNDWIETWEAYKREKLTKGKRGNVVLTMLPTLTPRFARQIGFPYHHGRKPFAMHDYFNPDGKAYTFMGLPLMAEDLQNEINAQHNTKLWNQILASSVMFRMSPAARESNGGKMRFTPGDAVIANKDEFEIFPNIANDATFRSEEDQLLSIGERLFGITMGSIQPGQSNQPRTATEIERVGGIVDMLNSFDVETFQSVFMQEVHHQTFSLIKQYMSEEEQYRFMGQDGKPIFGKVSPEDLQRVALSIKPHGSLATANKRLAQSKALARIATLQSLEQNLFMHQHMIDWPEAVKRWLYQDGEKAVARIVKPMSQEVAMAIAAQNTVKPETPGSRKQPNAGMASKPGGVEAAVGA